METGKQAVHTAPDLYGFQMIHGKLDALVGSRFNEPIEFGTVAQWLEQGT